MQKTIMILPAKDADAIRLIQIPADSQEKETYRTVTHLIADVQEQNPDWDWNAIATVLEDNGYKPVPFMIGPPLDRI